MRLRRIVRCYTDDDKRGEVLRDQLDRIGREGGSRSALGLSDWLEAARQSLLLSSSLVT